MMTAEADSGIAGGVPGMVAIQGEGRGLVMKNVRDGSIRCTRLSGEVRTPRGKRPLLRIPLAVALGVSVLCSIQFLAGGTATAGTNVAPTITSPNFTMFTTGRFGSFEVTTTGFPVPSITVATSSYPNTVSDDLWLHTQFNSDGTDTIYGTPPAGSAGTYVLSIQANNSVGSTPYQTVQLLVTAPGEIFMTAGDAYDGGAVPGEVLAFPPGSTYPLDLSAGTSVEGSTPNPLNSGTGFEGPYNVAVSDEGDLFVLANVNGVGEIFKVPGDGGPEELLSTQSTVRYGEQLAVDTAGDLFVTVGNNTYPCCSKILEYPGGNPTSTGGPVVVFTSPSDSENIWGLAVDGHGNIFFSYKAPSSTVSGAIDELTTQDGGGWSQTPVVVATYPYCFEFCEHDPLDLAVDGQDDVYVQETGFGFDAGQDAIFEAASNGSTWSSPSPPGGYTSGTSPQPVDMLPGTTNGGEMAWDLSGNLYIATGIDQGDDPAVETLTNLTPVAITPNTSTFDSAVAIDDGGAPAWGQLSPASSPAPTEGAGLFSGAMAYDPHTQQLIEFGGATFGCFLGCIVAGTRDWDGNTWTQLSPDDSPPALEWASMAYDPDTQDLVLFGGITGSGTLSNETWTWDGQNWTEQTPMLSPSGRAEASMAFDANTNQLVLFGGDDGATPNETVNDTWTWDGTTWTQSTGQITDLPSPRASASMAYDTASGQLVLFGGTDNAADTFDDTWTWNGVGWTEQNTSDAPQWPFATSMAYDPAISQLVLFGGDGGPGGAFTDQTWTWNGSFWNQVSSTTSPPDEDNASLAYDGSSGQFVLLTGLDSLDVSPYEQALAETWTYDGSGIPATTTPRVIIGPAPIPVNPGQVSYAVSVQPAGSTGPPPTGSLVLADGQGESCSINPPITNNTLPPFGSVTDSGSCSMEESAASSPYTVTAYYSGDDSYSPTSTSIVVTSGASSGGTAQTGSAGVTATATGPSNGTGTVTETAYSADPVATLPAGGSYFDVTVSSASPTVFTSVLVKDCASGVTGSTTLFWWNPTANSNAGGWETVMGDPADGGTAYSTTTGCLTAVIDGNSGPTLSQLTGTVFAVGGLDITTTSLPDGSVYSKSNKVTYSTTLDAGGGHPPYTWSLMAGSKLPRGLKLSSKGVISGKAKTAGTSSFTVKVVDTKSKTKPHTQDTASAALSITIT